jgi:hypothetical protein
MSADTRKRRVLSLHVAGPADTQTRKVAPSLALVKKALRLFRGRGINKATRHRNARKWLAANASLGEGSLLKGATPRWGAPGVPGGQGVSQVFAPRRLGGV